ncbi:hypothetical protein EDD65_101163 [Keratinibaculum paraultunense]|uniref:Uncharacterized protein n=1 Tax=Keratinibaculum paraultunense TaxID=1278232 RepID=A0A4V2UUN0_9FIRM|nr:hypothetical protein [Keratinibaculum paraultunense]QQY80017.1 hypothetical protein JL105_01400 [Keratinibaculum paraultunense]TCS91660.1 hypothetical protein EDD65_101163 [Keratinibaculum paraultunense]
MKYYYEIIEGEEDLPLKAIIHSVDRFQFHWHKELVKTIHGITKRIFC